MAQPRILAETQSLTAVRGEMSDPDRGTPALAETQSLTEVRGEASDPDRGVALAGTNTFTQVRTEANDPDAAAFGGDVEWQRGDRRPLLFKSAVVASDAAPEIGYDERLDMAVDADGQALVLAGIAPETMTNSAKLDETSDSDR